ncbi:hypothetical protein UFOVP28_39 [uncultured Caudovirales phage]|uniref:Uncharacterized protein n=1 Tax=uncultured Caudovirales phage TaxID=2100421 RepID=A0A6J5KNL9_9CAUD|nr:hypothetical protein UFOVP28_39 [uncultured Caudovirales phage]
MPITSVASVSRLASITEGAGITPYASLVESFNRPLLSLNFGTSSFSYFNTSYKSAGGLFNTTGAFSGGAGPAQASSHVRGDGTVALNSYNYLARSQQYDLSPWTNFNVGGYNASTAPNGGQMAQCIVENTAATAFHAITQNVTKTAAVFGFTYSVYVKALGASRDVGITVTDTSGANGAFYRVNPTSGTVVVTPQSFGSTFVTSNFTITSYAMLPAGNGWYRCTMNVTSDGSGVIQPRVELYNGGGAYTGDGVSGVQVWGAQLEVPSLSNEINFPATYIPTAGANASGPRVAAPSSVSNFIINSVWTGAVAGAVDGVNTGTLPTGWFRSNNTQVFINLVATGSENGQPYIDLQFTSNGASIITATQSPLFAATSSGTNSAQLGQTWTGAFYCRLVAGSVANITSLSAQIQERIGAISNGATNANVALSSTVATRYSVARTISNATSENTIFQAVMSVPVGPAVNATYRFYSFQLEPSPVLRTYLPTGSLISIADDYTAVRGNIVLQSQTSTITWTALNVTPSGTASTTDPLGGNTAQKIIPTAGGACRIAQGSISTIVGQVYCFSTWLKNFGRDGFICVNDSTNAIIGYAKCTLSGVGTITLSAGAAAAGITNATITPTGSGWYRCSFNFVATTSSVYAVIGMWDGGADSGGYPGNISGVGTTFLWGAQVEQVIYNNCSLTYPTTYIPTQSVPIYTYTDPISGPGMLIEDARTNESFNTNSFITSWNNTSGPIVPVNNSIISPSGLLNGTLYTRVSITDNHAQQGVTKAASALPYTASIHAKAGTARYLYLGQASGSGAVGAVFDLWSGTIFVPATLNLTYTGPAQAYMIPLGNGWYRCAVSATTDTVVFNALQYEFTASGALIGSTTAADVAGLTGYVYGAQLEQGLTPSSYIPCNATSVSRAAEYAYISVNAVGSGSWAWGNEWCGVSYTAGGVNSRLGSINDGTLANEIYTNANNAGQAITARQQVASVASWTPAGSPAVAGSATLNAAQQLSAKTALGLYNGQVYGTVNAATPTALQTGGYSQPTPTRLVIGGFGAGASSPSINGYVRNVVVYQGGNYNPQFLQLLTT